MRFKRTRTFSKQYKKLPPKVKAKFAERLRLFAQESNHPVLRIHTLRGSRYPFLSMNVTGDYRAIFLFEGEDVVFYEIGTHSQLYG